MASLTLSVPQAQHPSFIRLLLTRHGFRAKIFPSHSPPLYPGTLPSSQTDPFMPFPFLEVLLLPWPHPHSLVLQGWDSTPSEASPASADELQILKARTLQAFS